MSDELVLYQYGGMGKLPSLSPPCLKVFLTLKILEIPHRVVDLASPKDVARFSPSKRVPALHVGSEVIVESIRIMDRLQELHPDGALWQSSPAERARERAWDCFVTDTLYWLGFYQRWLVPKTREFLLDSFLGKGFSLKKSFMRLYAKTALKRRACGQGVGMRPPEDVREAYLRSLDMVVDALEGGPFLGGRARPGRADVSLAGHLAQLTFKREHPAIKSLFGDRSVLVDQVAATFEAAGLESP